MVEKLTLGQSARAICGQVLHASPILSTGRQQCQQVIKASQKSASLKWYYIILAQFVGSYGNLMSGAIHTPQFFIYLPFEHYERRKGVSNGHVTHLLEGFTYPLAPHGPHPTQDYSFPIKLLLDAFLLTLLFYG
jgi:hypothetical protein